MQCVKASALGLASAKILGKGDFAKVFEADLDGQPVAVKQASPSAHAKRALLRERDALQRLSHPNIVRLEAATEDGRCLVLELCQGGTLEERLAAIRGNRSNSRSKSRRQPMPVRRIIQIALEVMRGIGCMHEAGLCHGDIKSANILLATPTVTARSAGVKLADMGFCRGIGERVSEEDGGSPPFVPRELQLGLEAVAHAAQDVYACGVTILDMLCTAKPYEDLSVREFEEALEEGTLYARGTVPLAEFRNTAAADDLADLVFRMVSHDPAARPTAVQAVQRLEALAAALDGSKETARTLRQSASPGSAESGASSGAAPLSPSFCAFQASLPSADLAATGSMRGSIEACISVGSDSPPSCNDSMQGYASVPQWETASMRGSIEARVSADGTLPPSRNNSMQGYSPVPQSETASLRGSIDTCASIDRTTPRSSEASMHGDSPMPESDADSDAAPPYSVLVGSPAGGARELEMALFAAPQGPATPTAQGAAAQDSGPLSAPISLASMDRPPTPPGPQAGPDQPRWGWPYLSSSMSDALLASRCAGFCGLWRGRRAARPSYEANSDAPAGWNSFSEDMSPRSAISEVLMVSPRREDAAWLPATPPALVKQDGEAAAASWQPW